ncbi:PQQ-binding-like beta-propeller repeat protein [Cellulomonas sp. ATA003]|uniref:outer membrane protein assembly factor BamB family protein n=1 Tax=Cellulomonas sp. ATA003 TaxID=3073064 RepID=UPI00287378AC|nr:PQQ-binding-like beta-propeller repeat protein [Cellulomonas sp. ATA003]WNB86098.1 PQQ-binding-like beta-propeller repeat protein [Cellulomonas sp. ATA003]
MLADGEPVAVERRPGSVTVATFAVDLATGEELDAEVESGRPHPYEEHALPGGARATWAWRPDRASGRGQVSGSAARTYPLPGPPLRPTLTDGDDRGVLVVRTAQRERLRGLDLRSGRIEWSRPTPAASSPAGPRATALVDGVMLLDDGAGVTALEVRTGDDLWRRGVDADATDGPALTDGDVVLLPVRDGDVLDLVAHRIADGTVVWRAAAPEGTVALRVVGHRLVAATGAEVIGLG